MDKGILFDAFIRHAEGWAWTPETATSSLTSWSAKFWEVRAGTVTGSALSRTLASVAEDLANLAREVLLRAAETDHAA
ncbi:hypothetical protein ACWEF9_18220 [Streptomyces sp. NPDC004980]